MQPNIDIMSITELKSLWLDQLLQIEACQLNVKALQSKIVEKQKQASPNVKPLDLVEKP